MTTKHNVIVVGGGLFGCITAALARAEGHKVLVIDQPKAYAASKASGCVLSPNWLNSMHEADIADSLAVLKSLYTLVDLDFKTNLMVKFKAKHIDPSTILKPADIYGEVLSVTDGAVDYRAADGTVHQLQGVVVVCAGVWSQELVPGMPKIRGLYGASFRIDGDLPQPQLSVYAPYRQAVGFNIAPHTVWFGDGSALIERTWKSERQARLDKTLERAQNMLGRKNLAYAHTEGARPYVEGHKAGYFERFGSQLWVSTGGAKNGTVLAAHQALKFVKELRA